ncbi:MAG TPA: hypothetical protein VJU86_04320 [Pyrinomonadaceae bacterium]|nr:hypothetical protein [Pyrinomonadaceae bacterium]
MRGLRSEHSNFAIGLYFLFKLAPAIGAIFSIYLGYRLFLLGVTGQASLSLDSHSVKGQLLNAAPGLFFAIGGIAVLLIVVWKSVDLRFGGDGNPETGNPEEVHFNQEMREHRPWRGRM